MEADVKSIGFSNTIGCLRLFAAMVLTPLAMMVWLGASLDATMTHSAGNPDGPARVMDGPYFRLFI